MADERLLTLNEILAGECELDGQFGKVKLVHSPIGSLVLPTGRIVTRDPMTGAKSPALAVTVAPGSYPASLVKRVATQVPDQACFLIVRFSGEPSVNWKQARVPGEDARQLRIGARLGFTVDSATVGVLDESIQARLDDDPTRQAINQAFEAVVVFGIASVSFVLDPPTGATLVATKTEGDGAYGAYWGFGENGRPVALVTDLNLQNFARPSALDAAAVQARIKKLAGELIAAPDERTQTSAVRELEALGGAEARKLVPLAEIVIYNGVSEGVRSLVPMVLGRLADADPLLREDYRRLLLTGEPPPRLACGVAVARNISWTEQDADVVQALLRLVETATEPRLLCELIRALSHVRRLLPDGEVERRLEPMLQHEHAGVREWALRQLAHEFSNVTRHREGPPSNEERQRFLAGVDRAMADPSVGVRIAASRALRDVLFLQPAHYGRLLQSLRDPAPEVASAMAMALVSKRFEWAADVFAPVSPCIARLALDERLDAATRRVLQSKQVFCSRPLPPPHPTARPMFAAGPVELRQIPPGKMRLTNGGQALFEVETRRVFEVSLRPADAGQSWLLLGGCFKPYGFERVNGTRVAVGPLPHEHAAELVKRMSYLLTLPVTPVVVPFEELQRTPDAFHGMFVETEGEWQLAPEVSALGKVWLTAPNGFVKPVQFGKLHVRASGILHAFPRAKASNIGPGGYGHLGMWPGELEAYEIAVLGVG